MESRRARLDRFLARQLAISRSDARILVARGRVAVDGVVATVASQLVEQFSRVTLDQQVLQAREPVYVMLNKPAGVVSATCDDRHPTVIDLLHHLCRQELHIVGRLDVKSTGLLLLTNDGNWSRRLTDPLQRVAKRYRVTVENPLSQDYVEAFAAGMYFDFEGLTTLPAGLKIIGEREAEVTLMEGRYHQIRRMFGRFRNRVLDLHRLAIGSLCLDDRLAPGASRELAVAEAWQGLTGREGFRIPEETTGPEPDR